jgi:hypothetical protein
VAALMTSGVLPPEKGVGGGSLSYSHYVQTIATCISDGLTVVAISFFPSLFYVV